MKDHYLTAFSTQTKENSNNKINNFTYVLPNPLYLDPEKNWGAAVINFYHTPVSGLEFVGNHEDAIYFPSSIVSDSTKIHTLHEFVSFFPQCTKDYFKYNKEYIEDFLKEENYTNFLTDSSNILHKHKVEFEEKIPKMQVGSWSISLDILGKDQLELARTIMYSPIYYEIPVDVKLTLNQILYLIVKQTLLFLNNNKIDTKNITATGFTIFVVRTFLLHLLNERVKAVAEYYSEENINKHFYIILHADFVTSQCFNQKISQVLHTDFCKPVIGLPHQPTIPVYVPLVKTNLMKLKFSIRDENGDLLRFDNETIPVCIRIHIKPI